MCSNESDKPGTFVFCSPWGRGVESNSGFGEVVSSRLSEGAIEDVGTTNERVVLGNRGSMAEEGGGR